jgi:hypothetical protein
MRLKGKLRRYQTTTAITDLSVGTAGQNRQYRGPGTTRGENYDGLVPAGGLALPAYSGSAAAILFDSSALPSQGLITARYRKHLIVVYHRWFTFLLNTMRENAHGETDPR